MKTRVNLTLVNYHRLYDAAGKLGITRSSLVKVLIKQYEINEMKHIRLNIPVKYQEKQDLWYSFHVNLSEIEYECFLDLRKFTKRSVSLILAIAIDLYLDLVLIKYYKKMDNFPLIMYPAYIVNFFNDKQKVLQIFYNIPDGKTGVLPGFGDDEFIFS